jgi:hypothetical protein
MKTFKELYQEAIDVQDASNACGVAQTFARVMIDLGYITNGTCNRNKHLITTLWLNKLCSLNEYSEEKITEAYEEAVKSGAVL